jgi:hypothetical protein
MGRLSPILILAAAAALPTGSPASPPGNPMACDIAARLEEAGRREPDPARRGALFRDAAVQIPRALYGAILDRVLPAPTGSLDDEIARAIFLRWAWETPDYAAAWAAGSPPGAFRMQALAEAAGRWGAKNPGAALDWVRGLGTADRAWIFSHAGRFEARSRGGGGESWSVGGDSGS